MILKSLLRGSEIKRILGVEIEQDKCVEILQNLGFELLGKMKLQQNLRFQATEQMMFTAKLT